MARLISNDGTHFTFEGTSNRAYRVRFGQRIEPRSPTARGANDGERWGMLVDVRDNGTKRPQARWSQPKQWILLESLEKDYRLEPFLLHGEARTTPRPLRSGLVELPKLHPETAEVVQVDEPATDAGLMLFRGTTIRMRGEAGAEEMCLTDMWRANGSPKNQTPADWRRTEDAERFLAEFADMVPGHVGFSTEKGGATGGGGTWGHWQIAFRYAAYISAKFAVWVNQAAREKMTGRPVVAPATLDVHGEALRLLGASARALEARLDTKADKADVDAVIDRSRKEAREVAREEVAKVMAGSTVPVPPTPADAAASAVTCGKGVKDMLASARLPTSLIDGKFVFAPVVFEAIRRAVGGGPVPKGTFRVIEKDLPAVLRAMANATEELAKLQCGVDAFGNLVNGSKYTTRTVVKRLVESLARPAQPQLKLVPREAN